jgi:hypothetical protein
VSVVTSGTMRAVARWLLLLLTLAGLAAAPAAQGATVTLTFTSYTTVTETHDTAPRGKVNKGDSIDFKDLLVTTSDNQLGKKKGRPVGYDAGTVLYTSANTQSIEGVTTFPGIGTVTFRGAMKTMKDGTVHVPVIRGTGSFKGATGTLIIGAGNQKAPNTYMLQLPHPLCTDHCA